MAGIGDFNGDGFADILWRNETSGVVVAWFLQGTTRIGGVALTASSFPDRAGRSPGPAISTATAPGHPLAKSVLGEPGGLVHERDDPDQWRGGLDSRRPRPELVGRRHRGRRRRGSTDILWRHDAVDEAMVWFMDGVARASVSSTFAVLDQGFSLAVGSFRPSAVLRRR
jgi:hypothetical protein